MLASGRGSNFTAVVEAYKAGRIENVQFAGLLTDRPGTGAADYARANQIPVVELNYKSYPARSDYDRAVDRALDQWNPDVILTLGYMRLLNPDLVIKYRWRIINIHPSLLPAFPGMNSQKQAYDYGVKVTGATVHYIDEGVDTGPIIIQEPVIVEDKMDVDDLSKKILEVEHKIIVRAVGLHCAGKLKIDGRRVLSI